MQGGSGSRVCPSHCSLEAVACWGKGLASGAKVRVHRQEATLFPKVIQVQGHSRQGVFPSLSQQTKG